MQGCAPRSECYGKWFNPFIAKPIPADFDYPKFETPPIWIPSTEERFPENGTQYQS